MYGVEKRFKMQLLLGLKGSPLVGVGITNFVTPDVQGVHVRPLQPVREHGCSVAITVTFGHFGAIRLKGCAETPHKLALFEIP